jgi:hypothetical protein
VRGHRSQEDLSAEYPLLIISRYLLCTLCNSRTVMWGPVLSSGIIGKWLGSPRPRGAIVPFEAPQLRMARVCDDERDGLIAILRDFANNGTAYIVPWASLPLMVSMTDHDVALHTAVAKNDASTPEQVRSVVRDLALSGALGPEVRAREAERVESDRASLANVELVLILHLLDSCGGDLATLAADPGRWRDVHAKTAAAAAALGVGRREIYRRIAEFAKLLTPVGLASADGSVQSGWLRVLHGEIEEFSESITAVQSVSPDAGPHLAAIAESAKRTAWVAGIVLNMLDYAVLDIGGTIRRWTAELPVLRQAIDRLSLTLDEWPTLMKSVRDALRGPPGEMTEQLRALRSVLPPASDIDAPDSEPVSDNNEGSRSVTQVLGTRLSEIWLMLNASRRTRR